MLDAGGEERIRAFLNEITIIDLTREVKEIAVRLRRSYGLKLPDAVIAASAISTQAEFLTNDEQLKRVPGISVQQLLLKRDPAADITQ